MPSADFAQARERIAARQRHLDASALATKQQRAERNGALNRLPYPLSGVLETGLNAWEAIKGREGTRPALRVGQVDAELLDEELLDLLKGQVGEALKYYGAHLRDEWSAEISLCLRAILFKLSVWDHNASYGAALQGLRYTDARDRSLARPPPKPWQKGLYGLIAVGGRYAWTKWEDWLIDKDGGYEESSVRIRLLSSLTKTLSTAHSIAAFASFLIFLFNGRYRTLLDRFLRLRLEPAGSQFRREVSFEYLNRQLVWHAFTEFLLFLLPLIGISRWRRLLSKAWRSLKSYISRIRGVEPDEDVKVGGELAFLPERTCAICYQDQNPAPTTRDEVLASSTSGGIVGSALTDITNPYETIPCGCIYCFVCLVQRLDAEEGEGWTCLRCGELVKECKPWNGDVVEVTRSSIGKSVEFVEVDADQELKVIEPRPEEDDEEAIHKRTPNEEHIPEEDEDATSVGY